MSAVAWPTPDWECEGVRLYCGDCLDILPELPEGGVDCLVTDPPYGVTGDDDDYIALDWVPPVWTVLADTGALLTLTSQRHLSVTRSAVEAAGFGWLNTIVWWHRNTLSRQSRRFAVQYDPILYFGKPGFRHRLDNVRVPYRHPERLKYGVNNAKKKNWRPNEGGARCGDVWEFPAVTTTAKVGGDTPVGHKWQKPVALMRRCVKAATDRAGVVLDPYMGSGTTGVACIETGRQFVGIEIDPKYFDIAVARIDQARRQGRLFE